MRKIKNLGVLLIDDRSQRIQNAVAVRYADCLAWSSPEKFTVDVQCSTSPPSDEVSIFQCLNCMERGMQYCPFIVRFLHPMTRNHPVAQATIEINPYRQRTLTFTGSHDYFVPIRALIGQNALVEIDFFNG